MVQIECCTIIKSSREFVYASNTKISNHPFHSHVVLKTSFLSTMTAATKHWLKLKAIPPDIWWRVTSISKNRKEFLLTSSTKIPFKHAWYSHIPDQNYINNYNVHTNKWCQEFKYPLYWKIKIHSIAINKERNEIYLSTTDNNKKQKLVIINTVTKKYDFYEYNMDLLIPPNAIFNVNGKIHLIGDKHLMFDAETGQFKEIHNFDLDFYCAKPMVIYVESKMIFIVFMFKCDDKFIDYENSIWIFNINTNKWHQHETIINKSQFCLNNAVLSSNEKFIVMINEDGKLYVMDIGDDMNYKLSECSIKSPFAYQKMMRSGGGIQDEILVCGWIKSLFKQLIFKHLQLPPIYIIKIICNFYGTELIHVISFMNPYPLFRAKSKIHTHYAINIKYILLDAQIKSKKKKTKKIVLNDLFC